MFETVKRRYKQSEPILPESGSLYFNSGSVNSEYLAFDSNSLSVASSQDFTMEFYVNFDTLQNYRSIFSSYNKGISIDPDKFYALDIRVGSGSGGIPGSILTGSVWTVMGSSAYNFNPSTPITTGSWHHMAFVRSGSNWAMFFNGEFVQTQAASSPALNISNNSGSIGKDNNISGYASPLKGKLTNLRMVVGTALYTASFNPSSLPLTSISGSKILLLTKNDPNKYVDETGLTTIGQFSSVPYNINSPFPFNKGPIPSPTPTPTATPTPTPSFTPTPTPTPSSTPAPTPTPTPTPAPPPAPAPPTLYATVQMARQNPLNRNVNSITTSPSWGTTTKRSFGGGNAFFGPVSAYPTYFNYWKLGSNMQFVSPYTATSNPTYFIVTNYDTSTKTVIAYFK